MPDYLFISGLKWDSSELNDYKSDGHHVLARWVTLSFTKSAARTTQSPMSAFFGADDAVLVSAPAFFGLRTSLLDRFCPFAIAAGAAGSGLGGQILMMQRLLRDPVKEAYWYSGFGVPLYVLGMMASAVAV